MKIVVDTNIVFSALLSTSSTISTILFNSDEHFQFFACSYMRHEIKKHWEKLIRISQLTDEQLEVSYTLVLSKLHFINEELIPFDVWQKAASIVATVDEDDVDFVALSSFLEAALWTGDKALYRHLKGTSFSVLSVDEMLTLRSISGGSLGSLPK